MVNVSKQFSPCLGTWLLYMLDQEAGGMLDTAHRTSDITWSTEMISKKWRLEITSKDLNDGMYLTKVVGGRNGIHFLFL